VDLQKYYGFDAAGFEFDSSPFFNATNSPAASLFTDSFEYPPNNCEFERNSEIGDNLYTTSNFTDKYAGITAGVLVAHGVPNYIYVEFFTTAAAALVSATAQEYYDDDQETWSPDAVPSWMADDDGTAAYYSFGVIPARIGEQMPAFHQVCTFFNFTCYGAAHYQAFVAGATDPNAHFCYVSDPDSVTSDDFSSWENLALALMCPEDGAPRHYSVSDAIQDYETPGYPFPFYPTGVRHEDVHISPYIGCRNDAGEDVFCSPGVYENNLFWYLRRKADISEFKIWGRSSNGWENLANISNPLQRQNPWFKGFSCNAPPQYSQFYIEAIFPDQSTVTSSIALNVFQGEGASPHDGASQNYQISSSSGSKSNSDVYIFYQSHDSQTAFDPNSINQLISFYNAQGKSVSTVTNPYYPLSSTLVNQIYSGYYSYSSPPLLVLLGPKNAGGHPQAIGGEFIEDPLDGCASLAGCNTDWLSTDVDGDDWPDGPVTRIPCWTSAQLSSWVSNASDFDSGVNLAPYRQVGFLAGGASSSWFTDQMAEFSLAYSNLGYIPKEILHVPGLPLNSAWPLFVNLANNGLLEFWGAGFATSYYNWTRAMQGGPFDIYAPQISRNQGVIFWLPTCETGKMSVYPDGTNNGNLGIQFFDHTTTHAVALVGHNNGGWSPHHRILRSYLMAARESATPGNTTISDIAFLAINNFANDFPWLKSHALGLSVWGCDVSIQFPDYSFVDEEEPSQNKLVTIFANTSDRIFLRIPNPYGHHVSVDVFDVRGRKVKQLFCPAPGSTSIDVEWNGTDSAGRQSPSGVYIFRIKVGGQTVVKRATLLK
jgi:hypothetical protein